MFQDLKIKSVKDFFVILKAVFYKYYVPEIKGIPSIAGPPSTHYRACFDSPSQAKDSTAGGQRIR